jgi:Tfp pilus assembly protein PilN
MTTQAIETAVHTGALPSVNLLPPEIAERRKLRRLQFALGGVVVLAVVAVAGVYEMGHSSVTSAQQQLSQAQAQASVLHSQLARLSNVDQVNQQLDATKALYVAAMSPEIQWSHYLNDLSLTIPDNVWLTNISATESSSTTASTTNGGLPSGLGTVTFSGVAFTHDDVATLLEVLAKEPGYQDPYFSDSTETLDGPRTIVKFTSSVVLAQQALSGRAAAQVGN